MTSRHSSATLDQMAWTIDARGIDAVAPAALRELGFEARAAGAPLVLAELVADAAAPSVARQRAFGRIAQFLAAHAADDARRQHAA